MGFLESYFRGLFSIFLSDQFATAVSLLYALFPFWGPPLLAFGFYMVWIQWVRSKFIHSWDYVLLEIKLPREVYKSPLAMELALSGLFVTSGEATSLDVYILGKTRPWFSLEIASIDGNIHFYVWTRTGYRNVVESQLYGQYPDIEIFEVEDYTKAVPYFDPAKVFFGGHEYKLDKPDPYPIKTYVDYGLDKDPKEEFKIDPLTSVLEYMGSINKGEQIWMQIIIQAHKKKPKSHARFKETDIKEEAKETIKELLEKLQEKSPSVLAGEEGETVSFKRFPTKGESEIIAAIQRSAGKLNFDCGIRIIYAAKPEAFQGVRIPQTINLMRPFASKDLNEFAYNWGTYFDYPWQDYKKIRADFRRRRVLKAYRLRSWFHPPYKRKNFILSSEELATIYHFPGKVLQAPSVNRVMSKKAEAPINLPR